MGGTHREGRPRLSCCFFPSHTGRLAQSLCAPVTEAGCLGKPNMWSLTPNKILCVLLFLFLPQSYALEVSCAPCLCTAVSNMTQLPETAQDSVRQEPKEKDAACKFGRKKPVHEFGLNLALIFLKSHKGRIILVPLHKEIAQGGRFWFRSLSWKHSIYCFSKS